MEAEVNLGSFTENTPRMQDGKAAPNSVRLEEKSLAGSGISMVFDKRDLQRKPIVIIKKEREGRRCRSVSEAARSIQKYYLGFLLHLFFSGREQDQ